MVWSSRSNRWLVASPSALCTRSAPANQVAVPSPSAITYGPVVTLVSTALPPFLQTASDQVVNHSRGHLFDDARVGQRFPEWKVDKGLDHLHGLGVHGPIAERGLNQNAKYAVLQADGTVEGRDRLRVAPGGRQPARAELVASAGLANQPLDSGRRTREPGKRGRRLGWRWQAGAGFECGSGAGRDQLPE